MKNTLFIVAVLLMPFFVKAQDDSSNADFPKPFQYQVIDSTLGGTKTDLFVKANEWMVKTFVSAKDVIQMSDKDAGKIVAKGLMETTSKFGMGKSKFTIKFSMSIDVKDHKCRVKLYDFVVVDYQVVSAISNRDTRELNASLDDDKGPSVGVTGFPRKTWENIKTACAEQSKALMQGAVNSMKSKSDNW